MEGSFRRKALSEKRERTLDDEEEEEGAAGAAGEPKMELKNEELLAAV